MAVGFWSNLELWVSTFAWVAIAILAWVDSLRELINSRRDYLDMKSGGGDAVVIAHARCVISRWFVCGFTASLLTGVGGVLSLYIETDIRWILRVLLVFTLYSFFRAKKNNRRMRLLFEGKRTE